MSNMLQKEILSALLDKYERSIQFREQKQSMRRVLLKLYDCGKSEFPYYDIEQSDQRIEVNRTVASMEQQHLVLFEWMKGEKGHIIAKVWLNTDNLELAYQLTERKPKRDIIDEICIEILEAQKAISSPWAKSFFCEVYNMITKTNNLPSSVPADPVERKNLFMAIAAIDKLNGSVLTERVFSMQCYGDSKIFERVARSRVISILRKNIECDDDTRDEDLLRQVGVVKYPEQFEFCGDIKLAFEDKVVDFAALRHGSSISISDFVNAQLQLSKNINRVLTIENRANYIEYIQRFKTDDELVIYHAGQYSPAKKKFFLHVCANLPSICTWSHWSDIDYGGFCMLARLRREIWIKIAPYRMDISELIKHADFTAPISIHYANLLKQLLLKTELNDCSGSIEYMINNRVRLEQESMLI